MTTITATTTLNEAKKTTSRELSKRLFFLAGYALTGAALMGSSVGLVIYQSRQFYFLHRFSRSDEIHYHDHFHRHHQYDGSNSNYGQGQGLLSKNEEDSSSLPSSGYPHPHYHGYSHGHGHGHHHRIQSLFFSTWLPILVWFGSLLVSSFLIAAQKWVPKGMSARTGVLISQYVFSLFWILLGAIQEVQERLVAQRRATWIMDPIAAAMDDSTQFDVVFELKGQIRAMILPLGTVWYLTVILLGAATGLLTASSSQLEKQLQAEYEEALLEEAEAEGKQNEKARVDSIGNAPDCKEATTGTTEGACPNQVLTMDDTKQPLTILAQRQEDARRGVSLSSKYTTAQRTQLGLLMFVLMVSQMKLFKWIVQAQSMAAFIEGTSTSVSLTLTLVGLFSGTIMTALGVRFLPRTTAATFA
ncbi:hypothetical protein BGX29_008241 [Mortierella sp. GBA35]|nr:hypothetical protein BGX29_008241 [Mortierella sp. GBA35]